MSEMVVQQVLSEAGKEAFDPALVSVDPQGTEVAADWSNVRTPETYLGFGRAYGFRVSRGERFDEPHNYPEPPRLSLNQWAPAGRWTLAEHAAVLNEAPGRIAIGFHARDVNLVMGPAAGKSVGTVSRARRRTGTGRRSRSRRRRARQRRAQRTADVSADPTTDAHR
jgi:hypothetical protein